MQTTCQEKKEDNFSLDLVDSLMKEIEFLRKENSKLKEKAIVPEKYGKQICLESADEQSLKKANQESAMFTSNYRIFRGASGSRRGLLSRGRGGRYQSNFFKNESIFSKFQKQEISFKPNEFPSLIDKSFKDSLFENKKDYSYHIKTYINNFLKIANKLNNEPQKIVNESEGYSTVPHEKINQLIGLFNCDPNLVKAAYDYGLLHSVYTTNGKELIKIPEVYNQASYYLKITKATLIYVRFYSATGEVSYTDVIQPTRLVKMGLTRDFILFDEKKQPEVLFEEVPAYLIKKRAWSFKVIADAIMEIAKTPFRVNFYKQNLIITSTAREFDDNSSIILKKLYWKIVSPEENESKILAKPYLSEESATQLCKKLYLNNDHTCKYCGTTEKDIPEILFQEENMLASNEDNDEEDDVLKTLE